MIMEFKLVDGVQFFLVLFVLVALPPCGELWHRTRADGFANVRFTHTHTVAIRADPVGLHGCASSC